MSVDLDIIAEELRSLLTEHEFNARWSLIEGYHQAGKIINELHDSEEVGLTKADLVQDLAARIGKSERTLWYAVKFHDKFPDLNALPEGKEINWNTVVKKHLTEPKEKDSMDHTTHVPVVVCLHCKKVLEDYEPKQKPKEETIEAEIVEEATDQQTIPE